MRVGSESSMEWTPATEEVHLHLYSTSSMGPGDLRHEWLDAAAGTWLRTRRMSYLGKQQEPDDNLLTTLIFGF